MTVQELIDELNKIEDKSKEVYIHQYSAMIASSSVFFIDEGRTYIEIR